MISFNKPETIDGLKLRQELRDAGIDITNDGWTVRLDADEVLWLDIDENKVEVAAEIVRNHFA